MQYSYGVIVIQVPQNKFLVVKHKEGHWGFPKGHIEEGETGEDTAKRELFEETGIRINKLYPNIEFKESYLVGSEKKEVTYFLARADNPQVNLNMDELLEFKWLGYQDIIDLNGFLAHDVLQKLGKLIQYMNLDEVSLN